MAGYFTEITKIDVPASAVVGEQVEIKVTVKNTTAASIYIAVTAVVNGTAYYFGDAYATPSPGQEATFTDVFTMVDRDVNITAVSWYWGTDSAWHQDDSATASVLLTTEVETLEVDITPVGVGYVTTEPASEEGRTEWRDDDTGTFPRGTDVRVTAHPNAGYVFDHWSDEIVGGISYQNPEYVKTMTEHRAVKAHFREEAEPQVQTLEVDISPAGTGRVTTEPASEEGKSTWYAGDTGTFPYNTIVEVTAVPATGYAFDHWSDEIVGGINYENPSYVQPMTEHRAVKAHFVAEGEVRLETLEVDITPEGKGYVTTDPVSEEEITEWYHNTIGTFPYGISVQVTAHPNEGYRFEKWSDEIVGGTSYANPAIVQDMTQRRTVKCHFREIVAPPDGKGITEVMVIHGTGLVTGTEKSLPVSGVEVDDWFKIKVTGANPSASELQMGLHYIITKPDASVIENTVTEAWPYTGGGASHTFIEPGVDAYTVDQMGDWNLYVELLGDDIILDTWEGLLFSGVKAPTPGITDMIPMLIMVMIMSMMMNIMPQLTEEIPKLGGRAWEATKEVAPVIAKKAAKKLFRV